jgi:hypothetical protein
VDDDVAQVIARYSAAAGSVIDGEREAYDGALAGDDVAERRQCADLLGTENMGMVVEKEPARKAIRVGHDDSGDEEQGMKHLLRHADAPLLDSGELLFDRDVWATLETKEDSEG